MTSESRPGGICLDCERYVEGAACLSHPTEALLDPRQEAVIDALRRSDEQRRDDLFARYMRRAGLVGGLGGVVLGVLMAQRFGAEAGFGLGILLVILATIFALQQARHRFRPRFGHWTGEDRLPELTAEEIEAVLDHPSPADHDMMWP